MNDRTSISLTSLTASLLGDLRLYVNNLSLLPTTLKDYIYILLYSYCGASSVQAV